MNEIKETYDAVVVGAGHAGCEAALALARMGQETIIFTVSMDSVAMMPCNPNIGGSSKGHLVKEIDALGGEMGKNIDKTYIQSKMLNRSKGPAVHSLRAQADKTEYTKNMRMTMENTEHLTLRQAEVAEIIVEQDENCNKIVKGIKTKSGATYYAKTVVLCTGVYLNARCIYGDVVNHTGPNGLSAATYLSDSLVASGIPVRRFKTGTPARIDKRSIDFSKMEEQKGDETIVPFSFTNTGEDIKREQISCWLTYTNEETHNIIRDNIDRSPLFSGAIEGTGPRYCPSIEDKVMKFADKNRHQVFVEPEGEFTNEMYIGGMSSSLPEDVQYAMYRSVPGLENAKIVRNAYAIEYDCISALLLKPSLEFKEVEGLFSAGQMNGSSGYEEAAAQGLMAGINAARKLQEKDAIVLDRSQGYIGVLIDDLVTKGTNEPYRMLTSRAEYRLLLRQDNADLRLTEKGHAVGLVNEERYAAFCTRKAAIEAEIERLSHTTVSCNLQAMQDILAERGSAQLKHGLPAAELLKRPQITYAELIAVGVGDDTLPANVREQVEVQIKYEGYIKMQMEQVARMEKIENRRLSEDLDYSQITGLRNEAKQKLNNIKPVSVGQASRISGVSPADISVLLVYLEQQRRQEGEQA